MKAWASTPRRRRLGTDQCRGQRCREDAQQGKNLAENYGKEPT